jgi:hypothetical protein
MWKAWGRGWTGLVDETPFRPTANEGEADGNEKVPPGLSGT